MIYNENGIILNEKCILEDYFNGSYINNIINESFNDVVHKIGRTAKAAWDWLMKKVGEFCQWLVNIPNRKKIFDNRMRIKNILHDTQSASDIISVKLKGKIVKYIGSIGYRDENRWIGTFNESIHYIDKQPSLDQIKSVLYNNRGEDNWFVYENIGYAQSSYFNTDEIVDFALSVSELSKPLKKTHNDIIKFNRRLDKDAKIDIEVIKEINHYFTQAMSSIRNLSYACITVCMNALKDNLSDSIETHKINDMSDEDKINWINTHKYYDSNTKKIIMDASEEVQLAAVQLDDDLIKYMNNPTIKVQLYAVQKFADNIQLIKNPAEETQLYIVKENPVNIQLIKNPTEKVQLAAVQNSGGYIQYIKNPTEKVQLAVVELATYNIEYIKNPTDNVINMVANKRISHTFFDRLDKKIQDKLLSINPDCVY